VTALPRPGQVPAGGRGTASRVPPSSRSHSTRRSTSAGVDEQVHRRAPRLGLRDHGGQLRGGQGGPRQDGQPGRRHLFAPSGGISAARAGGAPAGRPRRPGTDAGAGCPGQAAGIFASRSRAASPMARWKVG
jgi:hypothetical protein